jgi:hypothetical protein
VQVDEIALQSVLKYGKVRELYYGDYIGHVNVIGPYLEIRDPNDPDFANEIAEEHDIHDQREELLEGSRMINVGWMRCDLSFLIPKLCQECSYCRNTFESWLYRRPPLKAGDSFGEYLLPNDIPLPKGLGR